MSSGLLFLNSFVNAENWTDSLPRNQCKLTSLDSSW